VILTADEARSKVVHALSRMDQPSVDGLNSYVICEAARRLGFTVALSGLGGDEFFGGYHTFHRTAQIAFVQRWASRYPGIARTAARLSLARAKGSQLKLARFFQYSDFCDHPYIPQRTLFYAKQITELDIRADESADADEMASRRLMSLLMSPVSVDPMNHISLLEARLYMANTLLRDSDQMSMAHSVELRVPFADQLLAAYLLGSPSHSKGFGRTPKLWLRSTYGLHLPTEVFTRRKMGFTLPMEEWLRGALSAQVDQVLTTDADDLWSPLAVRRIWEGFLNGRVHWTLPWTLYVLKCWISANLEYDRPFNFYGSQWHQAKGTYAT
jgi:asparagine synthase (glutamine-hydrolysing)